MSAEVRVYRNRTRACWSIQQRVPGKGWRLVSHADSVTLHHAKPMVQAAGRARTVREGKKYVHAFIVGTLAEQPTPARNGGGRRVVYNPHKSDRFVFADNGHSFLYSGVMYLSDQGQAIASASFLAAA